MKTKNKKSASGAMTGLSEKSGIENSLDMQLASSVKSLNFTILEYLGSLRVLQEILNEKISQVKAEQLIKTQQKNYNR